MKCFSFKRAISFIISFALVLSLVPTFAIAAGEAITVDFTKNVTIQDPYYAINIKGDDFSTVNEKTFSDKRDSQANRSITDVNDGKLLQIDTRHSNAKTWLTAGTKKSTLWTISVPVAEAGNYSLSVTAGKWDQGDDWYIYVDGNYAGLLKCYDEESNESNPVTQAPAAFNTLPITPENGAVEITFAAAATYGGIYSSARLLLKSLTLTPVTEPEEVSYDHIEINGIPDGQTVNYDDVASEYIPITATVYMSDGTARHMNGYKIDENLAPVADAGNSFALSATGAGSLEKTSDDNLSDGVYGGNITINEPGTAVITANAKIDGTAFTEKYAIDIVDDEPYEVTIDYTRDSIVCEKGTTSNTWKAYGFSVLSTPAVSHFYADQHGGYSAFRITTSWKEWPVTRNDEYEKFRISKKIYKEGWYSVKVLGGLYKDFAQYSIYVDGKYAGDYNFYADTESVIIDDEKQLNAIYIPEGAVEIGFYARKNNVGENYFMPIYVKLTPAEAPVVSTVESAIPASLTAGETAELTARAKMEDSTYRSFGYKKDGTKPQDTNVITVTSSSPEVVEVSEVICVEDRIDTSPKTQQDIDPTTTTYKLTAKKPGEATITVTALVEGAEVKTFEQTVTVPSADVDAEDIDNKISYIVRGAETAFNDGINMTGYTAGDVGSHTLDTSFTATAKKEITVGNEKYNFAYWQTAGGTPIEDAGESYTFYPKSNFTLEAVYVPAEPTTDADKKVQFWNYNRVYLGDETVTDGKVTKMPDDPTLNGFKFEHWRTDVGKTFDKDTVLTDAITRVVAYFTAITDDFAVKFDTDGDGNVDKTENADYGEEVTAVATGENFSYWAIGGKPVSYEKEISFLAWNDVTVTAVFEGEKTAVPTVVLDKVNDDEFFIAYEVPKGYTALDAGIVFGSSEPRVDSTDGSKASVKSAGAKGQFTASPNTEAEHNVARGYVMYRDNTTNDLRILYTDAR